MTVAARVQSPETPHLDGLRIVAAVAVVILHYAEYTKSHPAAHFVFAHAGHLNLLVDLFFVISGYVIASQYANRIGDCHSISRFLWRRIARIYPLHLATLGFYLLIAAVAGLGLARPDNADRYPLSDVPAQLLLLHAFIGQRLTFNFPSWSLSAEMFCYVLFPLLAALLMRKRSFAIHLFVAALLANGVIAIATETAPWTDWINRGGAFRALPSFILGFALYRYRDGIGRPGISLPLLPVLLIFLIFGSAFPRAVSLAMVYAIAVLALRLDTTRRRSVLTRLMLDRWSHLTYSIYMLHVPVATVMLTIFARALPTLPGDKLALVPFALVALAMASHLSCRYFETPVRRAMYAAFDRRRSDIATRAVMIPQGETK